jgi:hypothetical protein
VQDCHESSKRFFYIEASESDNYSNLFSRFQVPPTAIDKAQQASCYKYDKAELALPKCLMQHECQPKRSTHHLIYSALQLKAKNQAEAGDALLGYSLV